MGKIYKILFEPDETKLENPFNFTKNHNTSFLIVTNNYKKYLKFIYSYYNYTIISYGFFDIIKKDFNNVKIDNFKFYYKDKIIENFKYDDVFLFEDLIKEYGKINYRLKEKEVSLFQSKNPIELNKIIKGNQNFDFRENLILFYNKLIFFGFKNKLLKEIHSYFIKDKIIQKDFGYIAFNGMKLDTFKFEDRIEFKKRTSIIELININKESINDKFIQVFIDKKIYLYYKLLFNTLCLYIDEFTITKYRKVLHEISSLHKSIR